MLSAPTHSDWPSPDAREGPAVLRLRMLEIDHALRVGGLRAQARIDAERALAALRQAVMTRPTASLADAVARARTRADLLRASCEAA